MLRLKFTSTPSMVNLPRFASAISLGSAGRATRTA